MMNEYIWFFVGSIIFNVVIVYLVAKHTAKKIKCIEDAVAVNHQLVKEKLHYINEDNMSMEMKVNALSKKFEMFQEKYKEIPEDIKEKIVEESIEKINKKWDDGIQSMMNYSPFGGNEM